MSDTIKYEVEVVGTVPPFRWSLYRIADSRYKLGSVETADSLEEAAFDAKDRAARDYDAYISNLRKRVFVVFEGPARPAEDPPDGPATERLQAQVEIARERPTTLDPANPADLAEFTD